MLLLLRLKFKFRRGSLPPMMPLEFVGCIGGCDETLREVLDLKYLRGGAGGGGGGRGLAPGGRGAGGGGGGGRGVTAHSQPRACPVPSRADPHRPPGPPGPPPFSSWPPQGGGDPSGDVVVCNCGKDALLLTTRKDGPNKGRPFYKCDSGNCNFFLWADQPSQQGAPPSWPAQPPARPSHPPRPGPGFGNIPGGGGRVEGGEMMCNCNEPSVTRTVLKEGPNKGRSFHACGKPREQQCGFFQWADENVPQPGKRTHHTC